MSHLIENYNCILECNYKNEHYSVRNNGAVKRHSPLNKRSRTTDNIWTFGKLNARSGYLEIASVPIHRIVATAFHGEPSTIEHVVDHIDTNKQNNRPSNLRWVTRFENLMLNPITVRRIEIVCGSIEVFLENPSKFRDKFQDQNHKWMCSVSSEESQLCKEKLMAWAKNDKPLIGGSLGDWLFKRGISNKSNKNFESELDLINSLTPNAVQKALNWKTPSEFPCCPNEITDNPISTYLENLHKGDIFSRNQYNSSKIERCAISKDNKVIWIICISGEENPIKPYLLAEVTFKNNVFVHASLGTFFEKEGVEKQFTLVQGLDWNGLDSIEDYC